MRPVDRSDRECVVALMGVSKRQGRWRVERPLTAVAVMGDVVLDLRGAEVPQGDVDITATAVMGDVKILGDSYAQPIRRTLLAWLTREDRDRRAIE
jgi:hypothetical protein